MGWRSWDHLTKPKAIGGLGFKELQSFNVALLTKMAWRFEHNPNAHWVRTIKGIYFPHRDFRQATKGGRASWAWTSLLAGPDVLMDNGLWTIGNGLRVNIFTDAWIPQLPGYRFNDSSRFTSMQHQKVVSILEPPRKQWNLTAFQHLLTQEEIRAIKNFQVVSSQEEDKIIWPHSKTGVATVKSVYRSIIEARPLSDQVGGGLSQMRWKDLWAMQVIPKVRSFMWRLNSGALAVKCELNRRGMDVNPCCPFCDKNETMEHMLFGCPWTIPIWFATLSVRYNEDSTMSAWFEQLKCADNLSKKEKEIRWSLVGMVSWSIWKERCRAMYENGLPNPVNTTMQALKSHGEFWSSRSTSSSVASIPATLTGDEVWVAPEHGMIKLNCDASWEARTRTGGVGVVARDHLGRVQGGMNRDSTLQGPLILETYAIREALRLARQEGWQYIVIESDSKEAVEASSHLDRECDWRIRPFIVDIRKMTVEFSRVQWSVVSRKANEVANWIAIQSRKRSCFDNWVLEPRPLFCR